MRKKRLTRDERCQLCGAEKEDTNHLFFECGFARTIWALSPYVVLAQSCSSSFKINLFECMQLSDCQERADHGLWSWILWRIWKIRNEVLYEGKKPDSQRVYNLAQSDSFEWFKNHLPVAFAVAPSLHTVPAPHLLTWTRPPDNMLKCNTDATWQDDFDRCGIGWILRDSMGRVVFWGAKTYPRLHSVIDAEATSLVWAVSCLWNMGKDNIIFECDSLSLIDEVNHKESWPRLHSYTSEIQSKISRRNWNVSFSQVNRQKNKAADSLAKYATEQQTYFGVIDNSVPLWLRPSLDM